jgi:hypothetical protein
MGSTLENRTIEIDHKSLKNLDTARRWAMFISILGFIFLGLLIIIGIIAGTFLTAFSGGETASGFPEYLMLIIYFILALAYFFPILYLFRFSKQTATAVKTLDKNLLYIAIRNLKSYFVHIGILIIIVLSFYIAALILAGTAITLPKNMG